MGLTTTIFNAVLDDLRDIKTADGFDITLANVYDEPIARSKAVFPYAALMPHEGGRQDELDTFNTTGVVALFTVQGGVRSMTPHADLMNLLDSVINAFERKGADGGNTIAIAQVYRVEVVNWEFQKTEEVTGGHYAYVEIDVAVQHHHTRGSR